MYTLFHTPLNTPLVYALLGLYTITASITVYDTRLIQAKRNNTLDFYSPMLPTWVGWIAWLDWIVLLSLLLLNWKIGVAAWLVKFILSVLPVLEVIGAMIMSRFTIKANDTETHNKRK